MIQRLREHGCNVDAGIRRFLGKEHLYLRCLEEFLNDTSMQEAEEAARKGDYRTAMDRVHQLKGASGNLEFGEVYKLACRMMDLHREDRTEEAMELLPELRREYDIIVAVLKGEDGEA